MRLSVFRLVGYWLSSWFSVLEHVPVERVRRMRKIFLCQVKSRSGISFAFICHVMSELIISFNRLQLQESPGIKNLRIKIELIGLLSSQAEWLRAATMQAIKLEQSNHKVLHI